jgi:hypothetical protein
VKWSSGGNAVGLCALPTWKGLAASPRALVALSERRDFALFCAQLGENKIHSIELALLHARGKYLIANALTYFQRATTYHARYATYSYVEKQRSALRYFVIRLTNWLNVGMRQGSPVLGWAATFDARTTEACPMSSGRIHLPRLLEDADGSRASDFPTGKRHLHPQSLVSYTKCNWDTL